MNQSPPETDGSIKSKRWAQDVSKFVKYLVRCTSKILNEISMTVKKEKKKKSFWQTLDEKVDSENNNTARIWLKYLISVLW